MVGAAEHRPRTGRSAPEPEPYPAQWLVPLPDRSFRGTVRPLVRSLVGSLEGSVDITPVQTVVNIFDKSNAPNRNTQKKITISGRENLNYQMPPSSSKSQQRLFGAALSAKRGQKTFPKAQTIATKMTEEKLKDFAAKPPKAAKAPKAKSYLGGP